MKTIGIDIGTTTISLNVIGGDPPKVIQKFTLPNESFLQTEHPWERVQDVEAILGKALPVLDQLLDSGDVEGIGLTGQMHGIVYVDCDGKALSPLYTWQDGRGNLPQFQGKTICELVRDQGVKAPTGYGMITHLYNSMMGLVPQGAASVCTIADYVGLVLTGRKRPLVHISQAAGLGFFNVKRGCFRQELADCFEMDFHLLPPVTRHLEILGYYRAIPVIVSLGDNQASFLGSVRNVCNSILVNVGTGSQISVYRPSYWEGIGIEARPFLEDSFLLVGAALCGGAAYEALEHFFREYAAACGGPDSSQYAVMAQMLEAHPDQGWQVCTTFSGTREDPRASGSISGIRMENFHPASLIRGVLWGMAEELVQLYNTIHQGTGFTPSRLVVSGNGARQNPELQKILAERFHLPICLVEHQEEAAFGAALTALAATGRVSLAHYLGL